MMLQFNTAASIRPDIEQAVLGEYKDELPGALKGDLSVLAWIFCKRSVTRTRFLEWAALDALFALGMLAMSYSASACSEAEELFLSQFMEQRNYGLVSCFLANNVTLWMMVIAPGLEASLN